MRVQVFIDGGNFHHLALRPTGLTEAGLDFDAFASFLADGRGITPMGKRYYIGTVRERPGDLRSKQAMATQVRLFNILKRTAWQIKTSKLRERTETILIDSRVADHARLTSVGVRSITHTTYREKGIDVKIATDLAAGAVDNRYDVAIVVSSDTDLIPMIDWVRMSCRKRVEYVGFSIPSARPDGTAITPTQSLMTRTDIQRVLVASDVRRFALPQQTSITEQSPS